MSAFWLRKTHEKKLESMENLKYRVVKVIHSCNREEQLQAAETYACLAGLRLDPIVNEAIKTMNEIFNIYRV